MKKISLICFLFLSATALIAQNLPVDPTVQEFTLKNGLRCWVKSHKTPSKKVSIMLNVGSGSMNENDDQQGLAHFLEHLAFNGSTHFPPGTLTQSFERMGIVFGNQLNAYTSSDETVYQIDLPDVTNETIDKGLTCMADFGFGMLITPKEVDKERGVILEEMRARAGVGQRISDKRIPITFPKSRLSIRMPIGKKSIVETATRKLIYDYYKKWYRPDICTLIVVGDVDVPTIKAQIEKRFNDWKRPAKPAVIRKNGITSYVSERAAIITDPEWKTGNVSIHYVKTGDRTPTKACYRKELVQDLGNWILTRRLQTMVNEGKAPFQFARAGSGYWYKGAFMCTASASGDPQDTGKMLSVLVREIQRARAHGFSERELKQAVTATVSGLERAVKTDATRNSKAICGALNHQVSEGYLSMSSEQTLNMVNELIKGIGLAEVNKAFSENFTKSNRLILGVLPDVASLGKTVQDAEVKLLRIVKDVEARTVAKKTDVKELTKLLDPIPKAGKWTTTSEDKGLGVFSGTLDNGVRVHVREMDYKKDQVIVRLTVSGGSIMEDAENQGITQAAILAFNQAATSRYTSTQIRNYMTGKKVGVSAGRRGDCITISIGGSPDDVEHGFQLAHLLINDAKLEESALNNWKKGFVRNYDAKRTDADARLGEELYVMLQPDMPRFRPLTPKRVVAITTAEAQAWLKRVIANGMMEASIVGDIPRERALKLAATYFGSLPKRPTSTAAIDARRVLAEQTAPRKRIVDVPSIANRSVVLTGWRCPGWRKDKREVLAIKMAMMILQTRIREEIREERSLTYSAGVFSSPSTTYENVSFMGIYFTADPNKAETAMNLAREIGETFAKEGPTDEEMETARKQLANKLDQTFKEPSFWAEKLADLDYHGFSLDYVKAIPKTYQSFTANDVREVMAKYVVDKGSFEIITKSSGKTAPKTK